MRGLLLSEDEARESLATYMRAAREAGYSTNATEVQAALIKAWGDQTLAVSVDRCGDYLRDLSRRGER